MSHEVKEESVKSEEQRVRGTTKRAPFIEIALVIDDSLIRTAGVVQ
jgi:hypothetical protein